VEAAGVDHVLQMMKSMVLLVPLPLLLLLLLLRDQGAVVVTAAAAEEAAGGSGAAAAAAAGVAAAALHMLLRSTHGCSLRAVVSCCLMGPRCAQHWRTGQVRAWVKSIFILRSCRSGHGRY
jgi:hypothetical protein